ncbi:hypothetical protein L3Q65_38970 [Amycolatopsis sp. FU40]|uniref:DUF3592 domain-containing protein n=2 Tax=Amycolatopsis dendrobii TaxID=2760662 RepID=A0A7W3Z9U8_9PSEU|nr:MULTISPECIES: DUF3592 domain-containing protein [Amycolatopsis]MBB1153207.1 hypothetical protein [Amycolatopsis dendrobii]UKD53815.1 hypothetical protein L3Q65_38970 [Amycolatopsis sp. FU40]
MAARSVKARRIAWFAVLGVAVLLTVMCVSLVFAAFRNDSAIESHLGTANATVESVAFDRTIIQYQTPDGIVHSPATGVLYPSGLAAGQLVAIEYDATNPELTRVAGRTATLTLLPVGMTVLITWLVAGPLLWWLRRLMKRDRSAAAPEPVPAKV